MCVWEVSDWIAALMCVGKQRLDRCVDMFVGNERLDRCVDVCGGKQRLDRCVDALNLAAAPFSAKRIR